MSEAQLPHEPAPAEPRNIVPARPLLVRGLALMLVALTAGWAALATGRTSLLLRPLSLVFGGVAVLAAWAAAIQLTGGEKFDDHLWI